MSLCRLYRMIRTIDRWINWLFSLIYSGCCVFHSCVRLALARVSVLRGQGPQAGTAFIDDYVMSVEPVVDYLTRWSGIKPGQLIFLYIGILNFRRS